MDNCPAHPGEEELVSGDTKTMFLLPNITPLLQPMDQGVLENLKHNHKNKLLNTLINAIDEGEDGVDSNKISIKESVYMSAEAWDEVKSSEIVEKVIELLVVKKLHQTKMKQNL